MWSALAAAALAGLECATMRTQRNAPSELSDRRSIWVSTLSTRRSPTELKELSARQLAGIPRDRLVISTKKTLPDPGQTSPENEIKKGLEQSLKHLGTDCIDVYHLHGVEPKDYDFARDRLMPAMRRLREQGKIRFIGVTEGFVQDPSHQMLQQSLNEDLWDVVMVGFNLLNPSARRTVFSMARDKGVGVLNMFAVRRALESTGSAETIVADLSQKGALSPGAMNAEDPLDFMLKESNAKTLPEVAYRFCRHERWRRCRLDRHRQSGALKSQCRVDLEASPAGAGARKARSDLRQAWTLSPEIERLNSALRFGTAWNTVPTARGKPERF